MKKYIKGDYKRSIYKSDQGYIIGLFKVIDTNDEELTDYISKQITFTGYFHELKEDETYIFYGELIDHPKYGFQYQVTEYELVMPTDSFGIIEFLSSDLFPGIGDKLATNIVNTLGNDTLERIIKDPSCLNLVPKLTSKNANKIVRILNEYSESHQIIVYLTELGFIMKDAMLIYNIYKNNSINILESDPYQIIDEVSEINFVKIDNLKRNLNIKDNDESRIKACVIYNMNKLLFELGDTYLEYEDIKKTTLSYLQIEITDDEFEEYLNTLVLEEKIVIEDKKYYTKKIYDDEEYITKKLSKLINREPHKIPKLDDYIKDSEKISQVNYNEKQKEAIKKSLKNNILIITGGPGTGKTTIIKEVVNLYSIINKKEGEKLIEDIALLAPTGRASKRMSESTNLPASTIHRFLKWNKETDTFMVNNDNPDNSKLIIVDEVSMLDIDLMSNLLKGIKDNIQLILVGDYNQLPSVGPGQVLKDLIESDMIDKIELDTLYRQSDESYIPTLASEIKNNDLSEEYLKTKDDYTFVKCDKENIVPALKKLSKQIVDKGYDYKRAQLMAPMYAGVNGIDNLNRELQVIFNPKTIDKIEITSGEVIFREKDKILQLVNMPEENVFNGDVGYIDYIIPAERSTSKKNEIYVNYDGNVVKYLPKDFHKIKHGFVITIHKSQGSEFELVMLPICTSYYRMLYRKLIYTAVTRAKQKLIIIGEPNAFNYAVSNNNERLRKTSLKEKLINSILN